MGVKGGNLLRFFENASRLMRWSRVGLNRHGKEGFP